MSVGAPCSQGSRVAATLGCGPQPPLRLICLSDLRIVWARNPAYTIAVETILTPSPLPVPLTRWEDGSIRINGSRVTLDVIIHQFKLGATAEQIQDSFPSLTLHAIYGAIYYYLDQTEAVEEYLRQRVQAEEETRRMLESRPEGLALREKLRARRRQPVKA